MATKTVLPCLAVHINFPQAVSSVAQLRHVRNHLSGFGRLVHWVDYMSQAGYSHHSSRSMAVFAVSHDDKITESLLRKRLNGIVGIASLEDYKKLENREIDQVKPIFMKNHVMNNLKLSLPTLNDPFFEIDPDSDIDPSKVRLNMDFCIPMILEIQDLS